MFKSFLVAWKKGHDFSKYSLGKRVGQYIVIGKRQRGKNVRPRIVSSNSIYHEVVESDLSLVIVFGIYFWEYNWMCLCVMKLIGQSSTSRSSRFETITWSKQVFGPDCILIEYRESLPLFASVIKDSITFSKLFTGDFCFLLKVRYGNMGHREVPIWEVNGESLDLSSLPEEHSMWQGLHQSYTICQNSDNFTAFLLKPSQYFWVHGVIRNAAPTS